MIRSSFVLCASLALAAVCSAQCPITRPPDPPFVPPAAYAFKVRNSSFFPYGTDELWTELQVDGKWVAFGKEGDGWVYQNKLTFWHRGFDWRKNENPKLTVTGKRLDGDAPKVTVDHANAVFIPSKEAAGMMTLFAVPTLGCWEITARYEGHELSFVVSVEPEPAPMTTEELELYGIFLDSFFGTKHPPIGFTPRWSGSDRASLAASTVPLILPSGDKDGCLRGAGFEVSEAASQPRHEFPASITEGRAIYRVDPNEIGATDRQAGVLSLSEIGFDDDHRFAVFTWAVIQASPAGGFYMEGGTLVFRKADGKWVPNDKACGFWIT
jgi:hypothetical protein